MGYIQSAFIDEIYSGLAWNLALHDLDIGNAKAETGLTSCLTTLSLAAVQNFCIKSAGSGRATC